MDDSGEGRRRGLEEPSVGVAAAAAQHAAPDDDAAFPGSAGKGRSAQLLRHRAGVPFK